LFTPKNSISYSIVMFNADIPDAIAMRFIDDKAGYAQQELEVNNTPSGNREKDPDTIQKADLWGVTCSKQARRLGMYNYACLKNRPFVHTIETDIEYLICNKGDWIQYAGDIALAGSVQGRIKGTIWEDGVCIGIDTDEPVVMTNGKQHAVRIRLSNGTIILKDVVFNLGLPKEKAITYRPGENTEPYEPLIGELRAVDEDNVYYEPQNVIFFVEPLEKAGAPKAGDIYAFGVRGYEALDLIITDIQPGQNLTAVLTCVEYSPEIFGVDNPDFILPDFENKITPVSGAVDSGVVTPDRWRQFIVYNDSEDEPDRPSGDGQDGGWHHIQTFRSVWQSSKMAEFIDSGEWGLPIRIKAERGNEDITPIWLSLSPQNVNLETDSNGNLLSGITIQARLFKWNSLLSDVTFSLPGNPLDILINQTSGLINVNKNAKLNETNNIIVQAEYHGGTYNATLTITKNKNMTAPGYIGTVTELSKEVADVIIIKGSVTGQVHARQGDYVLTVAPAGEQPVGSVFQWSGIVWEYRTPENYSGLYMSCFKDGLDSIAKNTEWFAAAFARLLVVQDAFIEKLESQIITLQSGGKIKSENFDADNSGFEIDSDGRAEFNNVKIRGDIYANNGSFIGDLYSGVLFSSNQETGENMPAITFGSSSTAKTVWDYYGGRAQNVPVSSGSFGSENGIYGLNLSSDTIPTSGGGIGLGGIATRYILDIAIYNGSTIRKTWADASGQRNTLGFPLTIDGGRRGPVFKLNLPLGSAGLEKGELYKDSAGFIKVKS